METETRYDPLGGDTPTQHHDLSGDREEPNAAAGPSSLEMLRAAADAEAAAIAEEEAAAPVELLSPGGAIKLICACDITQKQLQVAQNAALPKKELRKPVPRMGLMDTTTVHARLIAEQTREVWVNGKRVDGPDGPLDFTSPKLLAEFNTADGPTAVRRIFGNRDHFLLAAGQDLLDGSGWGDGGMDGDDGDPHQRPRDERRSSSG